MTDMLQLALDSLREYEKGLKYFEDVLLPMDKLSDVARLAELRIGFAQALELRRIAAALETLTTAITFDPVSLTLHIGEE